MKAIPSEDIAWQRTETKVPLVFVHWRKLRAFALLDSNRCLSKDAWPTRRKKRGQPLKNAQQLADYLRFLAYSGAREQEALSVRWADVSFDRNKFVCIGADADTKNREARHVDFNPALESHLRAMHQRRAPDSQWLFPSPQRGEHDEHAKTFRESMKLARSAAGVNDFGFHDCRHHFISFAVMSGIDYMTIARWVGHKDGGVLIGKVYGHVSNAHAQTQAARLNFGPTVLPQPEESPAISQGTSRKG